MRYTEKADIAAKAVKVLDSVTMTRQAEVAEAYYARAMRAVNKAMAYAITSARVKMWERLDKPRYTLKDGEWVRKWPQECQAAGLKAGSGHEHYRMSQRGAQKLRNLEMANMAAQMNVNPIPLYGPHNALSGSALYDHRGQ